MMREYQILFDHLIIFLSLLVLASCWNVPAVPTEETTSVPEPPVLLDAKEGHQSVTLTWDPPPGGMETKVETAVTHYKIYYSTTTTLDINSDFVETDKDSGEFTQAVADLASGTSYNFAIVAVNRVGESDFSNILSAIPVSLPDKGPGPPENVVITPGNGEVKVTWSAPVDTGVEGGNGSAGVITKYSVEYSSSGSQPSIVFVGADFTEIVISQLTNGTTYTFSVKADNGYGPGTSSQNQDASPIDTGTFFDRIPGSPENVAATPRDQEVSLSWSAPVDTGIEGGNGSTGVITEYLVEYSSPSLQSSTVSVSSTSTTIVIDQLTNGESYTFSVKAANGYGTGPASQVETVTLALGRTPGPPDNVAITTIKESQFSGEVDAMLTWSVPVDPGEEKGSGIPGVITMYKISYGKNTNIVSVFPGDTEFKKVIGALGENITYDFEVVAVNGAGEGQTPGSVSQTLQTPVPGSSNTAPAASVGEKFTTQSGQITLEWSVPSDTGLVNGNPGSISGYMIYYTDNINKMNPFVAESAYVSAKTSSPQSVIIQGLTSGVSYWFAVAAFNEYWEGRVLFFNPVDPLTNSPTQDSGIVIP